MILSILNSNGEVRASEAGDDNISMVFTLPYEEGDKIVLSQITSGRYLVVQLDEVLSSSLVYCSGEDFIFPIPFNEKRIAYSPKTFDGDLHLLSARIAREEEIRMRKNLAYNSHDHHGNNALYPHAYANVETRGESVFAARNAIDGIRENRGHGPWPYASWGINRDPLAELTLDFGRPVLIDSVVITTRADFPHDNWWKNVTLQFSDESEELIEMEKSIDPHSFKIKPRVVSWVKFGKLIQDPDDPSPFPALSQLEFFGVESM